MIADSNLFSHKKKWVLVLMFLSYFLFNIFTSCSLFLHNRFCYFVYHILVIFKVHIPLKFQSRYQSVHQQTYHYHQFIHSLFKASFELLFNLYHDPFWGIVITNMTQSCIIIFCVTTQIIYLDQLTECTYYFSKNCIR